MVGMMMRAGDFMASRVESELPRWKKLYEKTWKTVRQQRERVQKRVLEFREKQSQKSLPQSRSTDANSTPSGALIIQFPNHSVSPSTRPSTSSFSNINNPDSQLYQAITNLFVSVLLHVRLQMEVGDQIVDLLALGGVSGPGNEEVRRAIEAWNEDLLWLLMEREKEDV
jgi:TELO2-interacting protein 1